MVCEKCKKMMKLGSENSTQGWKCDSCGWNIVTTYIDEIEIDETEYKLYIRNKMQSNIKKVKCIAKIANVNFVVSKKMLEEEEICVLKAKAVKIKLAIARLQAVDIDYYVEPLFKY